jgi:carbonic anhydrase
MTKQKLARAWVLGFLVVFLTFGTAAGWETYTQPTDKKANKADAVKTTDTKEKHEKAGAKEKEAHAAAATHETAGISADEALQKLMEGNQRYLSEKFVTDRYIGARRTEVAKAQHPVAVILSCSDSRVPPEILFNQGIGDLFVVRTAGHVADDDAVGSIEYAVEHLGVRLIMVLGHERCGAVTAAVKGGEVPGHIGHLVEAIKPAVEKARGKHGDLLDNAIRENVRMVAENLATSKPILAELFESGELKIVGAYYDLDTGTVSMIYIP